MKTITLHNKIFEVFIPETEIAAIVHSVSNSINNSEIKDPLFIAVMNGAFLFASDVMRKITIPNTEISFIKLSSYGANMQSSGTVRLIKDISADITDRDVIIVEDIIDTGLTIKFLKSRFEEAGTKSITFVTCLYKADNIINLNFKVDYIGFKIPDKFVVGYGLDYNQKYRGLPSIYVINEEN